MAMRTGLASGRALLPRAPSMAPRRLLSSADGAGAGPEGLSDYWRMMESRVVKRKTREVGAGPSGRGRRDTTAWSAEAKSDGTGAAEAPVAGAPAFPGRLSVARIKEGHFAQARLVYETEIAPLLRESDDLLSNVLLLDHSKGVMQSISSWATPDAFGSILRTPRYAEAIGKLAAHFDEAPASDDVEVVVLHHATR